MAAAPGTQLQRESANGGLNAAVGKGDGGPTGWQFGDASGGVPGKKLLRKAGAVGSWRRSPGDTTRGARRQAGLRAGAVSSLSPPLSLPGLHVLAIAFTLEVSVGKTNTVMALNNSNVLLPCTFTTCIGFQDLVFTWYFNSTEMIYHGKIKSKASEPILVARNPRVEFVGSTTGKDNNISIVLKDVEFSDAGKYTCHVKNPKEKDAQHNATIFLTVVQKMVETDNTVTLIIVGVVGGLIGLLVLFMLVKRVVLFIIKKTQDGK
nr:PREDICTED: sodium channel subunit beta-4 [Opisthocomus hoazin]